MDEVAEDLEVKSLKLSLRWPSKSDKWTHHGAGSRRICPLPNGLPVWRQLPLDKKLPYIPIPPGSAFLSRGWPGEQLWSRDKAHDLRLYDMHGHVLNFPYEPLHDPHLSKHLQKDTVADRLKHTGHLHPSGAALCSLKDINTFREVTRMINLDQVHHAMKVEAEAEEEERRLHQIEEDLREKKDKWDLEQKLEEAAAERTKLKTLKKDEMRRRWIQNKQIKLNRPKKLNDLRLQNQEDKKIKSEKKAQKINENLARLAAFEKMQLLGHIRNMRERDRRLAHHKATELQENEQRRLEDMKKRWERKIQEMTQSDAIKEIVLTGVIAAHRDKVEKRKERAGKVKQLQDALVAEMRQKRAENRAELQRNLQETRIRKSILTAWIPLTNIKDGESMDYHIRKSVRSTFSEYNKRSTEGTDNYLAIMMCKEAVEKQRETPIAVSYVMDYILELTIEHWTQKILTPLIEQAKKVVLDYGSITLQELKASRSKKPTRVIELEKEKLEENIIVRHKERKAVTYRSSTEERGDRAQARRSFMQAYLLSNDKSINDNTLILEEPSEGSIGAASHRTLKTGMKSSERVQSKKPSGIKSLLFQVGSESRGRETNGFDQDGMASSPGTKKTSSVRFGKVEEIRVPNFPDDVRSVRERRMTPVPSCESLARMAWIDASLALLSEADECEEWSFPEKDDLENMCKRAVKRVENSAKKLMADCVQPVTRLRTIKKLAVIEEYKNEDLVPILTAALLKNEFSQGKSAFVSVEEMVAGGVARSAVARLLRPPEFHRKTNEFAVRYRIMFTGPRNPPNKSP